MPALRPPPEVPSASAPLPGLGPLTLVVLVCLGLGMAAPALSGWDLVQRPPGSDDDKGEENEPAPAGDDEGPPTRKPEPPNRQVPVARVTPALTDRESLRIEKRVVTSCNDNRSGPLPTCDQPNLDPVLKEPLRRLAACEAAQGVTGILSLGLRLDFDRGRVADARTGRSTTLSRDTAKALIECARKIMVGTSLRQVEHQHTHYWLFYVLRFLPPGSAVSDDLESGTIVAVSGQATVGWQTAAVREGPSRQAKMVAKLLYGTRIDVTGRMGDWYQVSYDGGESTGWVHRKALGM